MLEADRVREMVARSERGEGTKRIARAGLIARRSALVEAGCLGIRSYLMLDG